MTAPKETRHRNQSSTLKAQRVVDHGDAKKYRTEIPNIVLTLGLTTYELSLYVHLKRTAGSGGFCWKSTATLARETGMSSGMVSKAKEALKREFPDLRGKPLITVGEEKNPKGGKPTHLIAITDIWPENMAKFASSHDEVGRESTSHSEVASSPGESTSSHSEVASSPGEIRKEPFQEETHDQRTIEEDHQRATRADTRGTRLHDDFCLTPEMRTWAAQNAPNVDVNLALAEFVDYWCSLPGTRGRKLDWNRTLRNRLRELEGRTNRPRSQSKVDRSLAAVSSVLAECNQ
jgi:hypothetical protein